MIIAKLLSHRIFLLFVTTLVAGLIVLLMIEELKLFTGSHELHSLNTLHDDEESIAILLIGFGVLLEGRQLLLQWQSREAELATSTMTHYCEYYGFVLLTIGLFIEIIEQCLALINHPDIAFYIELAINYPLNLLGLYLSLRVAWVLSHAALDQQSADRPPA